MPDFNSALYKLIGVRVKELRCNLGYSQEELSQKTQVLSRTSISNIEVGRHQPPLHILSQISRALNTEMHFLLPTENEVRAFINTPQKDILGLLEKKDITEPTKRTLELIINKL